MSRFFTWEDFALQGSEILSLKDQILSDTLVHAVLLKGEAGLGKRTLTRLMGKTILCEEATSMRPCGKCKSCQMAVAEEHPDLIEISPGERIGGSSSRSKTSSILVDDIRAMIQMSSVRPLMGEKKVFLVDHADQMTVQAQNSLLKTLEEPPENTVFLMTCEHTESLLPTVISRCRTIRMKEWPHSYIAKVAENHGVRPEKALQAAELSGGSIGGALQISENESFWKLRDEVVGAFFGTIRRSDILKVSNQWKDRKEDAETILEILETILEHMLRRRMIQDLNDSFFHDLPPQWIKCAKEADLSVFSNLLSGICEARKRLKASVNFQAVFENLMLQFVGEGSLWLG